MNTKHQGQAEALKLLRTLEAANSQREAPAKSAKIVDRVLRQAMLMRPEARKGFASVVSDWLVTEVLGCGHNLSEYEAYVRRSWRSGAA